MMENRNGHDGSNNHVAVLPNGVILRKLKSNQTDSECLLCWKEARSPKCLCPNCSKQYCFQCIRKWLSDSKTKTTECPNCRCRLPFDDLVRCAADLIGNDDKLQLVATNSSECGKLHRQRNGTQSGSIKLVVKVIENDPQAKRLPNGNAAVEPMVNGTTPAKMLAVNGRHGRKSKDMNKKQQVKHTESNGKAAENVRKDPGKLINGIVHKKDNATNEQVNGVTEVEAKGDRITKENPSPHGRNGFKKPLATNADEESVSKTVALAETIPGETVLENGQNKLQDTSTHFQNGDHNGDLPVCTLHSLPLTIFCVSCNCCICEKCSLHLASHAEHIFQNVNSIYDTKLEKINREFVSVTRYLDDLGKVIQNVESNIDCVKAAKARKLQELTRLLHSQAECIEAQINRKLSSLRDQRDAAVNEVHRVASGFKKLEAQLASCSKHTLLTTDDEFTKRCSQLVENPVESFVHRPVPADLECDFIPEFRSEIFIIKDYRAIEPIEECRTSDVLYDVIGFGWRLHAWKSDHLSVTLMMTEGVTGRYEYYIELMHETDPAKSIKLTEIVHFEHHQTGPVHDLIENDRLVDEGFLSDTSDTLRIKFSVRPPTIVAKSCYQQEYIDRTRKDNVNEYDSNVITICNIRDFTTSIVLSKQYTDTVGSRWRLNVYPKGNNTNYQYLSTYVELCDGIAGRYQYIVELLHKDAHKQVKFQSEDHFRVGEIRGYQKFIRVKRVLEEGYLDEDGSILIRLSIRPATIALRCQYQEEYHTLKEEKILFQFNSQLSQHLTRIRTLREENAALQSVTYPEYNSNIFVMRNFSSLRQNSEDMCSENSYDDLGCCWRLIVYSNGDKNGRDKWLSVYLRLLEGIPGSYEYCVELLHNDPTRTIKMEGTQTFEIQEKFGWSNFARLDMICANGYINEEHDSLYFRFSLRPPNYKVKCESQHQLRSDLKRENELLKRELIPEYNTITYTLKNFSELQQKDGFVYSDPLCDDLGFTWRLLIYTNGHNEGRGCHLSVYLILFEGVSGSRFEYRVELLHRNPTANIKMEGVNVFKLKKIWGWPQYIHHDRLRQEGYLSEDNSLEFRLSICPPDIKLKCEYQQEFIRKLKENQK
ncbi:uncharacterized protein LOC129777832 [Toxorhynchites rutilus septentrionalis]|uniref:uncharacterized protein LOC129777832 n=1 Tax=Toxorhynchites rutilus septentrionalis TaxID=329112 RepID=UPI00247A6069|nr:uncharacterized protein LOC129777832 [Toxorhynchites rutilus septentrionalis]XP_055640331.1 uncharacterized protein LOC129777832 [Toxorhynchites rutilus septentrionalis]XP_055640332.1 uncharacterized protein LOC129777832 [Toxorhynchites rutilus septentrionalis]XP_055640333.1 uncharacterized protein LOC129777832 [Toxorhynchites rutilus septentrionalis]XP_055640334.1 uncharacterized protein LOC129777832 [Toxorhynchites rutilus septentrionalis]XP_055640335.1 uncharacterized protein LOC12977783